MSIVKPDVFTTFPDPTFAEETLPVPDNEIVSEPAKLLNVVRLVEFIVVEPSYDLFPVTAVDLGRIVIVKVPLVSV